ncbi:MAG: amidohydrolase family protein [Nitrospinota bacterium]
MAKILIGKGTVITMDPKRRIIRNGGVLVENDRIAWVGKWTNLGAAAAKGARRIDASGKIIMPGLIDSHVHNVQSLARGIADEIDLIGWMHERIFPYEAAMTKEDTYWSAMMTCVEMVRTGTTCVADPGSYLMDSVGRAWEEFGMRGILCWAGADQWSNDRALPKGFRGKLSTEETMREEEALVERWHGKAQGRIRVSAGVRVEPNASDKLLQRCDELAKKKDLIVQFHACVNQHQVNWVRRKWGKPTIEWMDSLGVLNDRWLLTHMAALTDHDVALVRARGTNVCHNPGATLHGAYAAISRGKFPEMIDKGVTVVLGCDSTAANNSLDMFRAMYQMATSHKEARVIPDLISPEKALEMATIDAARVMRWDDEIGSLVKGKKADVIVVDCSKTNWTPNYEFALAPNLVYSGDGHDVETVIIDGRVVYKDRKFTKVDEAEVNRRAQKAGERIMKRLPYRLKPRWPFV